LQLELIDVKRMLLVPISRSYTLLKGKLDFIATVENEQEIED
jgi:hypothetical protein